MRCSDAKRCLEQLGFDVRDGKRGGHKIFVHPGLPDFRSSSFNCGHGKDSKILNTYIKNIIKIINQYETDLMDLLVEG